MIEIIITFARSLERKSNTRKKKSRWLQNSLLKRRYHFPFAFQPHFPPIISSEEYATHLVDFQFILFPKQPPWHHSFPFLPIRMRLTQWEEEKASTCLPTWKWNGKFNLQATHDWFSFSQLEKGSGYLAWAFVRPTISFDRFHAHRHWSRLTLRTFRNQGKQQVKR